MLMMTLNDGYNYAVDQRMCSILHHLHFRITFVQRKIVSHHTVVISVQIKNKHFCIVELFCVAFVMLLSCGNMALCSKRCADTIFIFHFRSQLKAKTKTIFLQFVLCTYKIDRVYVFILQISSNLSRLDAVVGWCHAHFVLQISWNQREKRRAAEKKKLQ